MPVIPAIGRQRWENQALKASSGYIESSKSTWDPEEN